MVTDTKGDDERKERRGRKEGRKNLLHLWPGSACVSIFLWVLLLLLLVVVVVVVEMVAMKEKKEMC